MRGPLGLKDNSKWIAQFNIGNIMKFEPIQPEWLDFKGNILSQIQKKEMLEKILYFSITYFMTATELRLARMNNFENSVIYSRFQNVLDRYQYTSQLKNPFDQISQFFHLRSIKLVCEFIKSECPYINHIIRSYQEFYGDDLE